MFNPKAAFSGFSVDNMETAEHFYSKVLGLKVEGDYGGMHLQLPHGGQAWMYAKPNHRPATYTMLDFVVDDIDEAVDALAAAGVTFERYDGAPQDEKGVMRGKEHKMGPNIAWFKDPAGNILAVVEGE